MRQTISSLGRRLPRLLVQNAKADQILLLIDVEVIDRGHKLDLMVSGKDG